MLDVLRNFFPPAFFAETKKKTRSWSEKSAFLDKIIRIVDGAASTECCTAVLEAQQCQHFTRQTDDLYDLCNRFPLQLMS